MAHTNGLFGRRSFLFFAAAAATTLMLRPDTSSAAESSTRIIDLHSYWSDENFVGPFFDRGEYLPDALAEINHLFRDRHTNDVRQIDVRLLDLLHAFKRLAGYRDSFEIVCGYRSAVTNRKLRKKNRHVAKESRDIVGQAVDLRFHGLSIYGARDRIDHEGRWRWLLSETELHPSGRRTGAKLVVLGKRSGWRPLA